MQENTIQVVTVQVVLHYSQAHRRHIDRPLDEFVRLGVGRKC